MSSTQLYYRAISVQISLGFLKMSFAFSENGVKYRFFPRAGENFVFFVNFFCIIIAHPTYKDEGRGLRRDFIFRFWRFFCTNRAFCAPQPFFSAQYIAWVFIAWVFRPWVFIAWVFIPCD